MFAFDNLAPKLLLSEILNAPVVETDSGPKLASHGIYYNRVQLQGSLEGNTEQGYCVRDITGFIPVALPPPQATEVEVFKRQQSTKSFPVIVIGQILETAPSPEEEAAALEQGAPVPTPERYIKVKKLIKLSRESNISEQWMLEVDELARHVYPQMAAALGTDSAAQ